MSGCNPEHQSFPIFLFDRTDLLMTPRILCALLLCWAATAAIVDRTAIVVGKRVIKDSDIERDIAITSFLNGSEPDLGLDSRKKSAARLIDQELIRNQILSGRYPLANESEASQLLEQTKNERFANDAEYRNALRRLGITDSDLRDALLWQLTVLRFIEARFRPAVNVSETDIQRYYDGHKPALSKAHPTAKGVEDMKPAIEDLVAGEQVNKLLDEWLEQNRKETRVQFLEKSLQ